LEKKVKIYHYSLDSETDFYAKNIKHIDGEIKFDFVSPMGTISDLRLKVPALINVENCVAAMALAWFNGVTEEEIRMGIASYSGISRRFIVVYKSKNMLYIDDYAHHPNELRASIKSIRLMDEGKKITGIFQPHLYSRTRDFADDFAAALSELDQLILLDIYPARELPIDGISSQLIYDKVTLKNKILLDKEALLPFLEKQKFELLVSYGAGDIDRFVPLIKEMLVKSNA
jgi:UDP-N-acetylmuramate--alanine ligase